MIKVTEAIKIARDTVPELLKGEEYDNLRLEEVVFDDEHNEWHITLGYDSYNVKPKTQHYALASGGVLAEPKSLEDNYKLEVLRVYKIFRIGAEDGVFKGMLIREVG